MKVHDLDPAPGSRAATPRRVGRGIGGKGGKTAGRGTKGQGARGNGAGPASRVARRRCTAGRRRRKGFNNPFRVEYHVVNLEHARRLRRRRRGHPETLREHGLVAKQGLVKVLGRGELTKALTVQAHGFSPRATRAIEAAGGTRRGAPAAVGRRRPPARGQQHANR